MKLGHKIRDLRIEKGITQTELGKIVGVNQRTISTWEKCTIDPPLEALEKICNYFMISVSELCAEETNLANEQKLSVTQKDEVNKLIDRLIDEKIITDPDNIPEPVAKLILDAVRMDLRLKQLRK